MIPSPLSPALSPVPGEREPDQGFALLELLIALVLVSLALGLTAQLLMESSQMLSAAAAEQTDAPMPLVLARIRGDVRASGGFEVLTDEDGSARLFLLGHPAGTVLYERDGRDLRRTVIDEHGAVRGSTSALRGLTAWSCGSVGPRLLLVTVGHRRTLARTDVLPRRPGRRITEERSESSLVAPRGAGLGLSW
ncbi:MAG: prepilin-type N-terminal cleavage/methylation domain-containing protein [Acidobacteriota bacterium]